MQGGVRGAVVNGSLIVGVVTCHCIRRALLVDQGAAMMSPGGSLSRVGLDGRSALGDIGGEAGIDGSDETGRPEASSTSNSEERHGVR